MYIYIYKHTYIHTYIEAGDVAAAWAAGCHIIALNVQGYRRGWVGGLTWLIVAARCKDPRC